MLGHGRLARCHGFRRLAVRRLRGPVGVEEDERGRALLVGGRGGGGGGGSGAGSGAGASAAAGAGAAPAPAAAVSRAARRSTCARRASRGRRPPPRPSAVGPAGPRGPCCVAQAAAVRRRAGVTFYECAWSRSRPLASHGDGTQPIRMRNATAAARARVFAAVRKPHNWTRTLIASVTPRAGARIRSPSAVVPSAGAGRSRRPCGAHSMDARAFARRTRRGVVRREVREAHGGEATFRRRGAPVSNETLRRSGDVRRPRRERVLHQLDVLEHRDVTARSWTGS